MTETNTCLREIEVEIPAERVEKETKKVVREYARVARIPGFRPGKAPAEMIRRRFWDDIRGEVLHNLLPDSLSSALQDKKFQPVGRPEITDLKFDPDEPVRYKASFEVFPEITLQEYKGLAAPAGKIELTDKDVDTELGRLREQHAAFDPVTDRPAEDGDSVVASMTGTFVSSEDEGREPLRLENAEITLGADETLPGFTKGLHGVQAGEQRQFAFDYPKDYHEESLAGRTVAFEAEVTAVRRKQLPELDDELAQQVGDYRTLKDLKAALREKMEQSRTQMEKQVTQQNVLDALLGAHDFPVPEALVEQQMTSRVERRMRALLSQGIDPRTAQVDWRKIRAEQREGALREVRIGLLLERIAATEGLHPSEEEISQEIARLAEQSNQTPDALRARLTKDEGLDRIQSAVRSDKVIEFLVSHATLTTKDDR